VRREFYLEKVVEGEAGIEADNRKKFIRIEEPGKSLGEFEIENPREAKSFDITTSTGGESTIDSCLVHSN
jgi:hypothetical protein